ncbi:MAG: acyl-CoA thioesterase [Verrucomicrobiales bacterium]
MQRTKFETVMSVRPDDIDMNRHVHASRYQDYVLAARYDQMERCYGMPMEEFLRLGSGWVVHTAHLEYKRPLKLGDAFRVCTWIDEFFSDGVRVQFEIFRQPGGKLSCQGWFQFTLVNLSTGRAEPLPEEVVAKYAV